MEGRRRFKGDNYQKDVPGTNYRKPPVGMLFLSVALIVNLLCMCVCVLFWCGDYVFSTNKFWFWFPLFTVFCVKWCFDFGIWDCSALDCDILYLLPILALFESKGSESFVFLSFLDNQSGFTIFAGKNLLFYVKIPTFWVLLDEVSSLRLVFVSEYMLVI